jgi:hypothetical protein
MSFSAATLPDAGGRVIGSAQFVRRCQPFLPYKTKIALNLL